MNRRTLIKSSSLLAVTSILSASTAVIRSKRVAAQQFRRVDPSSSSCARAIDGVFRRYRLKVDSFDIRYFDRSGNYYMYASSRSSMQKIDDEQAALLPHISLDMEQGSDTSKSKTAQMSLDGQVFNDIGNAMSKESVTLYSALVSASGPNGEPCNISFPCDSSSSYCPGK